jgi:hypothetical protein
MAMYCRVRVRVSVHGPLLLLVVLVAVLPLVVMRLSLECGLLLLWYFPTLKTWPFLDGDNDDRKGKRNEKDRHT